MIPSFAEQICCIQIFAELGISLADLADRPDHEAL
jgi:hypothetical protein